MTVAAILQGASQVLVRVGYDRANTTLIARAAGVSVGSLYQYFPSKDAIFRALLQGSVARVLDRMVQAFEGAMNAPLEGQVLAIVQAICAHKSENPRLERVLKTELGRIDGAKVLRRLNERCLALVEALLRAHAAELQLEDPARAAFFTVHTVEGIVSAAMMDAPAAISDPGFARELAAAVIAMVRSLPQSAAA